MNLNCKSESTHLNMSNKYQFKLIILFLIIYITEKIF